MDFEGLAKALAAQFVTVWNAPVPFLAVCIALWFALRWFIRGQFETRLANAHSTIEMLERKIDHSEAAVASIRASDIPSPAPTEPRDLSVKIPDDASQEAPLKLVEFFRSQTKLQASTMAHKYHGQQMTVTGDVFNVTNERHDGSVTVSLSISRDGLIFFDFEKISDRLIALRKGDKITLKGVITDIDSIGISLGKSEIVLVSDSKLSAAISTYCDAAGV